MRLAFALYKYFPYGGLQRDFAAFVSELLGRGHEKNRIVLRDTIPAQQHELLHLVSFVLERLSLLGHGLAARDGDTVDLPASPAVAVTLRLG